MSAKDLIEAFGKIVTRATPLTHNAQVQYGHAAHQARLEVLMGDRVPPTVQEFQMPPSDGISLAGGVCLRPEVQSQPLEIFLEAVGLHIATVKPSTAAQTVANNIAHRRGVDCVNKKVDRLAVQIPAEPLKLRREQHRISMVDLLGEEPAASGVSANGRMSRFDLIELTKRDGSPLR